MSRVKQNVAAREIPFRADNFERTNCMYVFLATTISQAMEIWTNGSISPEMALVESAKILRKHLNPFVHYTELGPRVHAAGRGATVGLDAASEAKLAMSLAELKLSVRASNCLESENINTVRDLVTKTEDQLLDVRNFGETTLREVKEKLQEMGLRLGMRLPTPSRV